MYTGYCHTKNQSCQHAHSENYKGILVNAPPCSMPGCPKKRWRKMVDGKPSDEYMDYCGLSCSKKAAKAGASTQGQANVARINDNLAAAASATQMPPVDFVRQIVEEYGAQHGVGIHTGDMAAGDNAATHYAIVNMIVDTSDMKPIVESNSTMVAVGDDDDESMYPPDEDECIYPPKQMGMHDINDEQNDEQNDDEDESMYPPDDFDDEDESMYPQEQIDVDGNVYNVVSTNAMQRAVTRFIPTLETIWEQVHEADASLINSQINNR